jgi:hypothetical protein
MAASPKKEGVNRPLQRPQPRGEQNSTADAHTGAGQVLLLLKSLSAQGGCFAGSSNLTLSRQYRIVINAGSTLTVAL